VSHNQLNGQGNYQVPFICIDAARSPRLDNQIAPARAEMHAQYYRRPCLHRACTHDHAPTQMRQHPTILTNRTSSSPPPPAAAATGARLGVRSGPGTGTPGPGFGGAGAASSAGAGGPGGNAPGTAAMTLFARSFAIKLSSTAAPTLLSAYGLAPVRYSSARVRARQHSR
jgi:hypothetical protein